MRVAALYDIHGNLPALEAALREVHAEAVDRVVVGGDVLPGPMPREVLTLLTDLETPIDFLKGNGEADVLAATAGVESTRLPEAVRESIRWCGSELSADQRKLIAGWPTTVSLDLGTLGRVLFCHATPTSDSDIFTCRTPVERLLPLFDTVPEPTVVCGHTHMQFDRRVGDTRVVNAGSVGMPFGEPGAYWALLGDAVDLRRTAYDLAAAAARVRATSYPGAVRFAEDNVVDPPTEAAMLDVLERAVPDGHAKGGG